MPLLLAFIVAGMAITAGSARGEVDGRDPWTDPTGPAASGPDRDGTDEAGEIAYSTRIEGVEDVDLRGLMERSSQLLTLADKPPQTLAGLARRIERDIERFETVLRSEGYWDGEVSHTVDREASPVAVVITVTLGEPYRLVAYDIRYRDLDPVVAVPGPGLDDLAIGIGATARGADIVDAETRLVRYLRANAHPWGRVVDREVVVNHDDRTVSVVVYADLGVRATFGTVTFSGLTRTNESFARQWLLWSPGEPYNQDKVDRARADLGQTGLFDSVVARPADSLGADGALPVDFEVVEGKVRSLGGGLGYSTDRGPGGRFFWRHRNLMGNAEDLELSLSADPLQQKVRADFVRPNFRIRDRELFALAQFANSDTDAYRGQEAFVSSGLAWQVAGLWRASLGGRIDYSSLDNVKGPPRSILFGIPARVTYGEYRKLLDQSEGLRADLSLTPFVGEASKNLTFAVAEGGVYAYHPITSDKRFVLAGRVRTTSLAGEKTLDIPANHRIYAGGAGSVRGYAFQKIGAIDVDGDPVGGRSKVEVGAELRARVYGDFGVVPFVDGGAVFEESYPAFSEQMQWAAGIGLRYYSPAGPLRLDVGFPINRRPSIDDPFQVYVSLGQAF